MYGTEIFTPEKENNVQTITSMEVAEMIGKNHKELMRDIRRYISQINEANRGLVNERKIALVDFFRENTYKDGKGELRPCCDITKKGCEFIAHKLTGVKGTAFTAQYVNRFHDMEQALKQEKTIDKRSILRKNSESWFQRNNWKMKMICESLDWTRKYLYHKILSELSAFYNLEVIEKMYEESKGHKLKYKMDLIDYVPSLRRATDKYVDFLLSEVDDGQEVPAAPY